LFVYLKVGLRKKACNEQHRWLFIFDSLRIALSVRLSLFMSNSRMSLLRHRPTIAPSIHAFAATDSR
jgi:hypothetical protein